MQPIFKKVLVLSLASFLVLPVYGETPTANQLFESVSDGQGNVDTSKLAAMGDDAEFQAMVQGMQAPQLGTGGGRKQKADNASAMAAFGAVMGFASCAMLMASARKAQSPMKEMLMSQAMQQCSQAAQDIGNQNQNDQASAAVTSPVGMPPVPTVKPFAPPPEPQTDTASLGTPTYTPPTSTPDFSFPTGGIGSDNEVAVAGLSDPSSLTEANQPQVDALPGLTAPKVLDTPRIGFDEESAGGGVTPEATPTTMFRSNAGDIARGLSSEGEPKEESGEEGRLASGGELDPFAALEGGSGSAGGSKKKAFNLAGLLGKNGSHTVGGPGRDIIIPRSRSARSGKPKLNIFQYASFRYKKVTHDEGKVRSKLIAKK